MLDRVTGKVRVTSHNHGFAVDAPLDRPTDTPFGRVEVSHVCLNDDVVEGLRCLDVPAFTVQYHPESAAGPHDAAPSSSRFVDLMEEHQQCLSGPTLKHVLVIGSGPIVIGQAASSTTPAPRPAGCSGPRACGSAWSTATRRRS